MPAIGCQWATVRNLLPQTVIRSATVDSGDHDAGSNSTVQPLAALTKSFVGRKVELNDVRRLPRQTTGDAGPDG